MNHPPAQTAPMGPEQRRIWIRMVLRHPELTPTQKTVLLALETYADYRTGANAHPGIDRLTADCNLKSERAVRLALHRAGFRKDTCPPDCGPHLELIEQTRTANSRAGLASVYRLTMPGGVAAMTGTATPVNDVTTGTPMPVNNSTTGTPMPVNDATTGMAVHHDRHGHAPTTGMAMPPTLQAPSLLKHQLLVSESGTSPEQLPAITHTNRIPSEFCDLHPHGYRGACGGCANARTFKREWLAQKAAQDVAIANAEDYERAYRRKLIAACLDCDDLGRIEIIDGEGNHGVKPCDHPNVTGVEHAS